MPPRLLVSDANILIDMSVGNLLEAMFQLEYEFATPDILFEEELRERHGYLLGMGLVPLGLTEQSVSRIPALGEQYGATGASALDLTALALAQQENAPLLTGDKKLGQVCQNENVETHGILWLVDEIFNNGKANVADIRAAYEKMKADGSRLPWREVDTQLRRLSENRPR